VQQKRTLSRKEVNNPIRHRAESGSGSAFLTDARMAKMKLWWLGTALTMLGSSAGLCADQPASLTLEQALAAVETTNLNVLLGRETIAQAVGLAEQLRAGILPNIDLGAQQQRTKTVNIINRQAVPTTPQNRFNGTLTGQYSFLAPSQIANVRAARVGISVAQAAYSATLQVVLASVADSYFTHLRNLKRIVVLDANTARARSLLDLARNQAAAGVATRIDVTRAESEVALAEQARLQQDTVVYQSAQQLQRELDINPSLSLLLADFAVLRVPVNDFAASLEKSAFEQRADWLQAQKAVEQAKASTRAASFERLPSLDVAGNYGVISPVLGDSTEGQWGIGLGLSMPIFDGFRISADRRIALSRQRAQELQLHFLEFQISGEVRLAMQDANSRFKQIAVAENSLRLAEEEVRLAEQRYQQGVADNLEVVEAQNSLAVASDNLNEAIYDYNLSRVELARSRGNVRSILTEKAP
jgi:outer membrane protein